MDFQALLTKLRGLAGSMSGGQLISLVVSFVLVVAIIGGSALWLNNPSYTLLFADMDQETAASMVSKLKSLKVPYVLDDGGRSIRVASDRIDELRLELTAQGLPSSGRIGFEIFDRTTFGTTEFVEQVNFRRALEGEIARTIGTIAAVSSARVHIAPGKDVLFGEKRSATASVVLKLKDSRGLSPSAAGGIANLVAASVEGLRPEAVVILDSNGRPLLQPTEGDELGTAQMERQQRLERDMSTRVIALLEPVVGEGRVRVNVAMKLNPASRERTEEHFDPETVIRNKSTMVDSTTQPGVVAAGIAGARANLPPATPPPAVQTAAAGSSRQNEVTNYEISRTTTHTIEPPGDVARLSVAVILDDTHETSTAKDGTQTVKRVARKPEELQKLQDLVSAAVGLDDMRGDRITVQNVSFDDPLPTEPDPPGFLARYERPLQEGGRTIAVLVIGLVGLMLLRSMWRRTSTTPSGTALARTQGAIKVGAAPRTVADLESEIEAQLDAQAGDGRRLPVLTRRAAGLAQKEPANTAKLLRGWMAEG